MKVAMIPIEEGKKPTLPYNVSTLLFYALNKLNKKADSLAI